MRLLFVAPRESVHATRWIEQVTARGWEVHLFAWHDERIERDGAAFAAPPLKNVRVHNFDKPGSVAGSGGAAARRLARLIVELEPELVHSLMVPGPGYLVSEARRVLGSRRFPPWIASTWGIDLQLMSRLAEHRTRIRSALKACSHHLAEGERDARLARALGFRGETLPFAPVTGGLFREPHRKLASARAPSRRRYILVKGYQHSYGRALVALKALELVADELDGYKIGIYGASPSVEVAAQLARRRSGLSIELLPPVSPERQLARLARARIALGVSISDGVPVAVLEAMMMGAFPVQSNTADLKGWVASGRHALLVEPEDPRSVARALKRALRDDALVDRAAARNRHVIEQRLDRAALAEKIAAQYSRVLREGS